MNILLFTGAGLGVPLKLPITTEFQSVLNRGESSIRDYLSGYLGKSSNDVENVLSTLERFIRLDSFSHYIIQNLKRNSSFNEVNNHLETIKSNSINFIHEIKRSVYELLRTYDAADAVALYTSLILQLKSLGKNNSNVAISIFTTNYDLSFEDADELTDSFDNLGIKEINYGFIYKSGKNRFDKKHDYQWKNDVIEYKKLHGSLDWSINRGGYVRSGVGVVPARPEEMPLLYPGYKETPSSEPFKTIHDQLLQRLLTANGILIVGFAFRDPYINNLFDTALRINTEANFYCYNPSSIDSLPKESAIKKFKENYSNFHYIQEGASLQEEVLNLKQVRIPIII